MKFGYLLAQLHQRHSFLNISLLAIFYCYCPVSSFQDPVNGLGISQAYCANPQRPHHFLPQRGSGLSQAIEPRSYPTVAHTKAEYIVTQRPNLAHYCFCSLTSEPNHTHWETTSLLCLIQVRTEIL